MPETQQIQQLYISRGNINQPTKDWKHHMHDPYSTGVRSVAKRCWAAVSDITAIQFNGYKES